MPEGTRKARPAVLRPGRARQSSGLSGRAGERGPFRRTTVSRKREAVFLLQKFGTPGIYAGRDENSSCPPYSPAGTKSSCGAFGRARVEGPLPAHHSLTEHVRLFFYCINPARRLPPRRNQTYAFAPTHSKAPAQNARGLFPITAAGPAGGRGGSAPRCAPPARRRRSPRPARRSRRRGRPSPDRGD